MHCRAAIRDHVRQAQGLAAGGHAIRQVRQGLPLGHRSRPYRHLLAMSPEPRNVDRQLAQLQVRIAVLNGYAALGLPVTAPRRITAAGERGRPALSRFVQQRPPG